MNDKPVLSEGERESLKYLIERKAPFLKELLSEDALVNVDLSLADLEDNASYLFFSFCFALLSYLLFP